jgi:hypothetical protein
MRFRAGHARTLGTVSTRRIDTDAGLSGWGEPVAFVDNGRASITWCCFAPALIFIAMLAVGGVCAFVFLAGSIRQVGSTRAADRKT